MVATIPSSNTVLNSFVPRIKIVALLLTPSELRPREQEVVDGYGAVRADIVQRKASASSRLPTYSILKPVVLFAEENTAKTTRPMWYWAPLTERAVRRAARRAALHAISVSWEDSIIQWLCAVVCC